MFAQISYSKMPQKPTDFDNKLHTFRKVHQVSSGVLSTYKCTRFQKYTTFSPDVGRGYLLVIPYDWSTSHSLAGLGGVDGGGGAGGASGGELARATSTTLCARSPEWGTHLTHSPPPPCACCPPPPPRHRHLRRIVSMGETAI